MPITRLPFWRRSIRRSYDSLYTQVGPSRLSREVDDRFHKWQYCIAKDTMALRLSRLGGCNHVCEQR